jgi:hypothetical protein
VKPWLSEEAYGRKTTNQNVNAAMSLTCSVFLPDTSHTLFVRIACLKTNLPQAALVSSRKYFYSDANDELCALQTLHLRK